MDSRDGSVLEASLGTETQRRRKAAVGSLGRPALGQSWQQQTLGTRSHRACSCHLSCSRPLPLAALRRGEGAAGAFLGCPSDTASAGSGPCLATAAARVHRLSPGLALEVVNVLNLPGKMSWAEPNQRTPCKTGINPTVPTHRSKHTPRSPSPDESGASECPGGRSSLALRSPCAAAEPDAGC